MFKGDDKSWLVVVRNSSGSTVDITGAELIFTARPALGSSEILIERKNADAGGGADEIEMSDPTNGEFKIHLVPANTTSLNSGTFEYDVQMTLSSLVKTIIQSKITINEDVTK